VREMRYGQFTLSAINTIFGGNDRCLWRTFELLDKTECCNPHRGQLFVR